MSTANATYPDDQSSFCERQATRGGNHDEHGALRPRDGSTTSG
jgi:hypothetical protein